MLTGLHRHNYDLNMQRVIGLPDDPANQEDFYGAQLSLIYYRALSDPAQALFRTRVRGEYSQRTSGPATQNRIRFYRRLDAHFCLAFGAMSINPSFVELNSGPVRTENQFLKAGMLMQPWCLSDSEFQAARVVLRDGNMPNIEGGSSKLEAAGEGIFKSEILKRVSEWLRGGVPGSGIFRVSLSAPLRSSALGAFVATIQALLKSEQIRGLTEAFDKDEPRRIFLASVGWGNYVVPPLITAPQLPGFVGGVPTATR